MDGIDPVTHRPRTDLNLQNLIAASNLTNFAANPFIHNALDQLQKLQLLQTLIQLMGMQNFNPLALNGNEMIKPMNYSCSSDADHGSVSGSAGSFMTATLANSVPSLAAASPENCLAAQVNLSASSSPTSTHFDQAAGGGLTLDVLDGDDLGWKDILE